jgi:hypothetical protein
MKSGKAGNYIMNENPEAINAKVEGNNFIAFRLASKNK